MKKEWFVVVMFLIFVMSLMAPSLTNATGLERVLPQFEVTTTATVNGLELTITAGSKGVPGDGFMIQHQSKNYFLPEGENMTLKMDRPYDLFIAKAYQKDGERLVTNVNSKRLKFNYGLADVPNDTLDLAPMDAIRWLLQPSLIANMAGSGFFVDTFKVSGLLNHWDLAEVVYTGDYREKLKKVFWYLPSAEGIYSKIPEDGMYMSAQVNLCVIDKGNNRMIIAPSEPVKFTRSIMK